MLGKRSWNIFQTLVGFINQGLAGIMWPVLLRLDFSVLIIPLLPFMRIICFKLTLKMGFFQFFLSFHRPALSRRMKTYVAILPILLNPSITSLVASSEGDLSPDQYRAQMDKKWEYILGVKLPLSLSTKQLLLSTKPIELSTAPLWPYCQPQWPITNFVTNLMPSW